MSEWGEGAEGVEEESVTNNTHRPRVHQRASLSVAGVVHGEDVQRVAAVGQLRELEVFCGGCQHASIE